MERKIEKNGVIIADTLLEYAEPRNGRCKCCERLLVDIINNGERIIKTRTKTCPIAYVCKDCATVKAYTDNFSGNGIVKGKVTKRALRLGFEWEAIYKSDPLATRVYMAAEHQMQAFRDGSLGTDGHEFKTKNNVNLHGMKARIADIAEVLDLLDDRTGQHINASRTTWRDAEKDYIGANIEHLFNPLLQHLILNPEKTAEVWGRDFSPDFAAGDTAYNYKYNWLRYDHRGYIEFRLCKFQSVKQYFYLVNLIAEILETIDRGLEKGWNAQKIGDKILKLQIKYEEGKALCMRPERNAK